MEKIRTVIVDTNFLIDMLKFRQSFESIEDMLLCQCKFAMVGQSVKELEKIGSKYAKLGLKMLEEGRISIIKLRGVTADDAIISAVSKDSSLMVATNDQRLRKKIISMGAKVVHVRSRKKLGVLG